MVQKGCVWSLSLIALLVIGGIVYAAGSIAPDACITFFGSGPGPGRQLIPISTFWCWPIGIIFFALVFALAVAIITLLYVLFGLILRVLGLWED